jgi:tRNA pseudouridine38-40 synthase
MLHDMNATISRNVALVLEYDGTRYGGFQLQSNATTIQEKLEQAIELLTQKAVRVHGAGRTDQGVHALGQVASFSTESELSCERLIGGLNHFLPEDIAVHAAYDVSAAFDPRRDALSRIYRYTFLQQRTRSPLGERYAYRISEPTDDEAMRVALRSLEGEHDFACLSGQVAPGKSTVRQLYATKLWSEESLMRFEVEANAFLPHQMRRIAGLLLAVGTGRLSPEGSRAMLDGHIAPGLETAVKTLPPQGLCLMRVNYEDCQSE